MSLRDNWEGIIKIKWMRVLFKKTSLGTVTIVVERCVLVWGKKIGMAVDSGQYRIPLEEKILKFGGCPVW